MIGRGAGAPPPRAPGACCAACGAAPPRASPPRAPPRAPPPPPPRAGGAGAGPSGTTTALVIVASENLIDARFSHGVVATAAAPRSKEAMVAIMWPPRMVLERPPRYHKRTKEEF